MLDGFPSLEIPAIKTLALHKQWVLWRHESRNGQLTKVPYQANHYPAAVDRPANWSAIDVVYQAALKHDGQGYSGVGFVLCASAKNRIMGVDLDKCRDEATGEIEPEYREIIDKFATYTEVSPSKRGIRLFGLGTLPPAARRRLGRIEIYDDKRYLTVTGDHIEGTPDEIQECQAAIDWLVTKLEAKKDGARATTSRVANGSALQHANGHAHANGAGIAGANGATLGASGQAPGDDGLYQLLEPFAEMHARVRDRRMLDALLANSERFQQTWEHKRPDVKDWSASEYDMALANYMTAADWPVEEIMRGLVEHRVKHGLPLKMERMPRCDYYVRTIRAARRERRQEDAQDVIRATAGAGEDEPIDRDSVLEALTVIYGCQIRGVKRFSGDDVTFAIETAKGEIRADPGSLMQQHQFRKLFMQTTSLVPPLSSRPNHEKRVQAMLDIAEQVDTGPDANITELVRGWLIEWLAGTEVSDPLVTHNSDPNRPFMRDGRYMVSTTGFNKWLAEQRGQRITPQKLAIELRKLGCAQKQTDIKVGNRVIRRQVWIVAAGVIG